MTNVQIIVWVGCQLSHALLDNLASPSFIFYNTYTADPSTRREDVRNKLESGEGYGAEYL